VASAVIEDTCESDTNGEADPGTDADTEPVSVTVSVTKLDSVARKLGGTVGAPETEATSDTLAEAEADVDTDAD
jgi:hypothetical protein